MASQANKFQLTINNPSEKGYSHSKITEIIKAHFKTVIYWCMADEKGSCYHTHIFIVFSSRVRFSMVKKYFPEAHIEPCKGTVSDNVAYVKKSGKWEINKEKTEKKIEGTFEEYGSQPPDSKGTRADLSELYEMIRNGMTNAQILAVNQDYILQIDRIDKVRMAVLSEKYREQIRTDLCVCYVSGATGVGKTRGILDKYGCSQVYRVTDYTHPWDSYCQQNIVCFEEFRSSIRIGEMLNYCDIYPVELPCRYTNKVACYNKVFIVSNWPLERQYSFAQIDDSETWNAFLRRIKKVIIYDEDGKYTEYDSVEAYFKEHKGNCDNDETPHYDF